MCSCVAVENDKGAVVPFELAFVDELSHVDALLKVDLLNEAVGAVAP